jgi:hypothetical protein
MTQVILVAGAMFIGARGAHQRKPARDVVDNRDLSLHAKARGSGNS